MILKLAGAKRVEDYSATQWEWVALIKSLSVLVVEDEHLILELAEDALQEAGYEVHRASSGAGALEWIHRNGEGLAALVTDIRVGDGPDGWALARQARHLRAEMPVIYMTADSAGDWPVHGVPGSLLVQKPFAMAQMVTALGMLFTARDADTARRG